MWNLRFLGLIIRVDGITQLDFCLQQQEHFPTLFIPSESIRKVRIFDSLDENPQIPGVLRGIIAVLDGSLEV